MLDSQTAVFVLVDVQGKLASLMYDREAMFANQIRLVRGMKALQVPILWAEQNPEKMGGTIPRLAECLHGETPIAKMSFSCAGEPAFVSRLRALGRRQVLMAGIETHVCVFQTAADLVCDGYEVHVAADAVSSRKVENIRIGLERIRACGATATGTEMALLEMLRTAEHPAFREVLKIIR